MTGLRPRVSAKRPVTGLASRAKKDVAEVMRDLSRVVRARDERSVLMEIRVEEITPVLGDVSERSEPVTEVIFQSTASQRANRPSDLKRLYKALHIHPALPNPSIASPSQEEQEKEEQEGEEEKKEQHQLTHTQTTTH